MPILKFRVCLSDDSSIYRIFEMPQTQLFIDFHFSILQSFQFDNIHIGCFYTSNANWHKIKGISTEVLENKASADKLSAHKTKVGALVQTTDQRFLYEYETPKKIWNFEIEMLGIRPDDTKTELYPILVSSDGLSPSQYGPEGLKANSTINDIEEKYSLDDDLSLDGFSVEEG